MILRAAAGFLEGQDQRYELTYEALRIVADPRKRYTEDNEAINRLERTWGWTERHGCGRRDEVNLRSGGKLDMNK